MGHLQPRGRIVTVVRSYLVNTPSGTIRRNRFNVSRLAVPGSSPKPTEDIKAHCHPTTLNWTRGMVVLYYPMAMLIH